MNKSSKSLVPVPSKGRSRPRRRALNGGGESAAKSATACLKQTYTVNYTTFTEALGLASTVLNPVAAPTFPSETNGWAYYEVESCRVEYKPLTGMLRLGEAAFGATNSNDRVTSSFTAFQYLSSAVPAKAVTSGHVRNLEKALFHPVVGSRYSVSHDNDSSIVPPTVAWMMAYSKVTDNGVEIPNGASLGVLHVEYHIRMVVVSPPGLSAAVNVTHLRDTLEPLEARKFFLHPGRLLSSKVRTQVAYLGMPLGNPYWGGSANPVLQPPDVLAVTSPCDTQAHLTWHLHRLVPNADASTPALIAANALIPTVIANGLTPADAFLQVTGSLPIPIATPGFDVFGWPGGTTHTLISTRTSLHINMRTHQLPNRIPVKVYSELSSLLKGVEDHPVEACAALGLGIVTGLGAWGAGYTVSAAIIRAMIASNAAAALVAALQSTLTGTVQTWPQGSSPRLNAGISNSGFGLYPAASAIGSPAALSSEVASWMPGDPIWSDLNAAPVAFSSVMGNGTPIPPALPSGSTNEYRFYYTRSYQVTYPALSFADAIFAPVGDSDMIITRPDGIDISPAYEAGPSMYGTPQIVSIHRKPVNGGPPTSQRVPICADYVDIQLLGSSGTALPEPGPLGFESTVKRKADPYIAGLPSTSPYLANGLQPLLTENGVYMREYIASRPEDDDVIGSIFNQIEFSLKADNINAQRQSFATVTFSGRIDGTFYPPTLDVVQAAETVLPSAASDTSWVDAGGH